MKAFILCGDMELGLIMKAVVSKTNGKNCNSPILMHLIKSYCQQGVNEFVFCLGYKANTIQDYFLKENKKIKNFT